jgi:hypothetical protein
VHQPLSARQCRCHHLNLFCVPSFRSVCTCLSLQPCRCPGRRRPSRAGSPSPGSRPGGAGLRLACCLQRWPAASATGAGLPVAWGNTGGGRGGAGGGATGSGFIFPSMSICGIGVEGDAGVPTAGRMIHGTWQCETQGCCHLSPLARGCERLQTQGRCRPVRETERSRPPPGRSIMARLGNTVVG